MNLPEALRTTRWMVRDTFRQALHTKLLWVMLATTGVAVLFCLSIGAQGDVAPLTHEWEVPATATEMQLVVTGLDKLYQEKKIPSLTIPGAGTPEYAEALARGRAEHEREAIRIVSGEVTLAFGAVKLPISRSREDTIRMIELMLVAAAADTVGILLALLWTAGFLPSFLEPQSATVLLAKPAPRWSILFGKYLGVVGFVFVNALLFVGGTWLALGIKTGVWYAGYWLGVPLLTFNFAIFYAVSAYLAVWTRSTVSAAFGTLLFWLLTWFLNYSHVYLVLHPLQAMTPASMTLHEIFYWCLPKPFDMGALFFDVMRAEDYSITVNEMKEFKERGYFRPEYSILSSSLFAVITMIAAAYEFETMDY